MRAADRLRRGDSGRFFPCLGSSRRVGRPLHPAAANADRWVQADIHLE